MRWLHQNDALKHITSTTTCTSVEAQRYLKAQIGAEIIRVKWGDSPGANDRPHPGHLRGTKLNLSGTGLAYDKGKGKYRPLMVLHSALLAALHSKTLKSNAEVSKEFESAPLDLQDDWNDNDQSRWMTLVSAEEHIEVLQNCDSVEALRQLKEEIGDGTVKVRWADDPAGKLDLEALKTSQFILFGPGLAPDGTELRPLMVNSEDILQIWPNERGVKNTLMEPSKAEGPGRPSAREIIRTSLSKMKSEGTLVKGNQSEIARRVMKLNNIEKNEPGWTMRTVSQHVSDWLIENAPDYAKKQK
jgi:hypothetical protein